MDKASGSMLQEYTGNVNTKGYRLEAALDFDSKRVYCGSEDGKIYEWDFIKASKIEAVPFSPSPTDSNSSISSSLAAVHSLSYHPSEHKLAGACKNKISLWNCEVLERIEVDDN